ncbi:MAG: hypothetical protein WC641_01355 [Patescibacteria group bacterium]
MASVQDLYNEHQNADSLLRGLDEVSGALNPRGGKKVDQDKIKNQIKDMAVQIRDAAYLNTDNPEIQDLARLTSNFLGPRDIKPGAVKGFFNTLGKWKIERDVKFQDRLKLAQTGETTQKPKAAEVSKPQPKVDEVELKRAATEKEQAVQAKTQVEKAQVQEEEEEIEIEQATSNKQQATKIESRQTAVGESVSDESKVEAEQAASSEQQVASGLEQAASSEQQAASRLEQATSDQRPATKEVESGAERSAPETQRATASVAPVALNRPAPSAAPTAPSVQVQTSSKIERASTRHVAAPAAERAAGTTAAPAGVVSAGAAAVGAAFAVGAAQATTWLEAHQNLSPEQLVTQARSELGGRGAGVSEAAFQGRGEVARVHAQNLGFARGLSSNLTGRASRDASWQNAAQSVTTLATGLQNQTIRLEAPGEAETFSFTPEETAAFETMPEIPHQVRDDRGVMRDDRGMVRGDGTRGTVPESSALPASSSVIPAKAGIQTSARKTPDRKPRTGSRFSKSPLAPGQTIQSPITQLPYAPQGSGGVAASSDGIGPDYSAQTSRDEVRPSPLDEASNFPPGAMAQGETVPNPIYGGEEQGEVEFTGGGVMDQTDVAARFQSQQAAERRRLEQFAGAGFLGAVGASLGLGAEEEEEGEEEEETEEEEGEEAGAQGQPKQKSRVEQELEDRAQKFIEDKFKDVTKKATEKAAQRGGQQAAEKAAQQAAQKSAQAAAKSTAATTRAGLEIGEAVNTPDTIGITLLLMILQMNVQMIYKYLVLKSKKALGVPNAEGVPGIGKAEELVNNFTEQTFVEDVITIFLDCMIAANMCLMPPQCMCIIPIIIIIVIVAGTVGVSALQDILKTM